MKYNVVLKLFIICLTSISFTVSISGQSTHERHDSDKIEKEFSDRKAILKTIENFYIGDHTGSIKHKKLSMHENGAYRYVDRNGDYRESVFNLESDDSDQNYKEELLSVEIYDKVALAKLRLDQFNMDKPEYKMMILHKTGVDWKITTITWGFGITQ